MHNSWLIATVFFPLFFFIGLSFSIWSVGFSLNSENKDIKFIHMFVMLLICTASCYKLRTQRHFSIWRTPHKMRVLTSLDSLGHWSRQTTHNTCTTTWAPTDSKTVTQTCIPEGKARKSNKTPKKFWMKLWLSNQAGLYILQRKLGPTNFAILY